MWSTSSLEAQARSLYGYTDIGIRWESVTSGMKVIGLYHRTRGPNGCHLTTMDRGSLWATGTAMMVGLSMTTTGTATATGTTTGAMTGITAMTATTAATTGTMTR